MEIAEKIKTALDETRMLILGAQVLLGFQLRGVFSDGYDQLSTHGRYLDGLGLGLGLMVCVVGLLLIAPGPYHRIVMGGEDDPHLHRLVTAVADLALLPFAFALALGLDVLITAGRIFGDAAGAASGTPGRSRGAGSERCLPSDLRRCRSCRNRSSTSSSEAVHPAASQMTSSGASRCLTSTA